MAIFIRAASDTGTDAPRTQTGVPVSGRALRPHAEHRWWHPLLRDGVRPLFLAGDVAACLLATVLSNDSWVLGVAFMALLIPLLSQAGLYRSRLALSVLDDLPRLLKRWLLAFAVVLAGTQFLQGQAAGFEVTVTAGVALLLVRALNYEIVRFMRRRRAVAHSTVVVGADSTGQDIAQKLMDNPQYGLSPLGFLDADPDAVTPLPAPLLGVPQDLPAVLDTYNPRAVIIAHGSLPEYQLVELVRASHRSRCEVFVIPRLYEVQYVTDDMEFVWDTPLVRLPRAAYRSPAWRAKRIFDVVFAAVALVLLSPIMLACAVAVYLEGGRGVIFRQLRVGCDGRDFHLMKFRSLRPVNDTESQTQWNISHDSRLGPVGRVLRMTSLDELPQLVNILRGDMSLVGPRPERPHFVEEFGGLYQGYTARHRVPSGLTGWAQVNGLRGDTSIYDRAKFDNFYIENWSLWLDLKILLRTAISVVKSPGS
jgi:exopolysaccharide biosynthesis polyprenyl glycosylphosphotransferase